MGRFVMIRANRREPLDTGNQRLDDPGKLQKTLVIRPLLVPNEARYQTALRPDIILVRPDWLGRDE